MKILLFKSRKEFDGQVTGDEYVFIENDVSYCYIIHQFQSSAIFVVDNVPTEECDRELTIDEVADNLKRFHRMNVALRKYWNSVSTNTIRINLQELDKLGKECEENIFKCFVLDVKSTSFLISQIGTSFDQTQIKEVYTGFDTRVWEIGKKKLFTIKNIVSSRREREYSVVNIAEDKKKYEKKMRHLIKATEQPRQICKVFINNTTEIEAIRILLQIKEDKTDEKVLDMEIHQYFSHLANKTGAKWIKRMNDKKKAEVYNYLHE